MTVPGGYNTGSDYYGGQAQQPAGGYEPTAGYQQPAPPPSTTTYDPRPDSDYITSRIPDTGMSMSGAGRIVILIIIILGIILLLTAKIHAASLIKLDDDDFDDYDEYRDKVESITYTATILSAVATALIPLGLLIAAIMMEDLGPATRSGLAIAAGVILALTGFIGSL